MNNLVILAMIVLVIAVLALSLLWPSLQRRRWTRTPFPEDWSELLQQTLPIYGILPPKLRQRLHRRIQQFLAEKNFEGCGGLALTDEICLTIAAQACLLIIGRSRSCYPNLSSILVYPSAFRPRDGLFLERDSDDIHLGESWQHGTVVLAWDSVKRGAVNFTDGMNVAIHEFAHQLDQQSGDANGAPLLDSTSAYATWSKTLQREFIDLQRRVRRRRAALFDSYGATNPAEFFAVISETFFEKPLAMKKQHAELYTELRRFYKLDPVQWLRANEESE